MSTNNFVAQINGSPATAGMLAPLAFAGYAHFTAIQVRGGRLRGLDLHLQRLRYASQTLYGKSPSDDRLRQLLRAAIAAGPEDISLTATVYSPEGEFTPAPENAEPLVLIRTAPPASGPKGPLRLLPVEHERMLPAFKHVGEIAKTYLFREAIRQGFDDAAFLDRTGRMSEASIWNLAFWDGEAVVWPEADMLTGTSMGIVRRQLSKSGFAQRTAPVTRADLSRFAGAAVMNSWTPGIAVTAIGDAVLPAAPEFQALLHRAYQAEPLTRP